MRSPPSLTGGETTLTSVLVDWVSVVFPGSAVGPQGEFLKRVRRLFDGTVTEFRQRATGLHCYAYSCRSDAGGVILAWGGNADTVLLQIPGDACARVEDWHAFRAFVEAHAGHLTRVDLAYDDVAGVHTVDEAAALWQAGAFKMQLGGRNPKASQAGNWLQPDGTGRTLYVGKLTNGKELCVYEKGMQLGREFDPWVRWEARFSNRDRELPLAMLVEPVEFFRGAYPCLTFVAGEPCRIATRKAQERISVEKLTRHCREAYGPLVGVLVASGLEADAVIERVRRDGLPRRLNAPTDAEVRQRANDLAREAIREEIDCRSEVWR